MTTEPKKAGEIERLEAKLKELGWSAARFAREVDESPQNINNWIKRGKIAGNKRHVVAEKLGVSTDWLVRGEEVPLGTVEPDDPSVAVSRKTIRAVHPEDPLDEDMILIPESRIAFSGGQGRSAISYETVEEYEPASYRLSWLMKEGINPDRAKRFRLTGTSQVPMLFPGDSILVNEDETEIRSGFLYGFMHFGELRCKYLFWLPNQDLLLYSRNEAEHPRERIPAQLVDETIVVIGRVRERSGRGGVDKPIALPEPPAALIDLVALQKAIEVIEKSRQRAPSEKAKAVAALYDMQVAEPQVSIERLVRLIDAAG